MRRSVGFRVSVGLFLVLIASALGIEARSAVADAPPAPVVLSVTPNSGVVGGVITVNGSYFTGATGVSFDAVPAPGFVVLNDSEIQVVVPPLPLGPTTVYVTGPGGTSPFVAVAQFTVIVPSPPAIDSVSPSSGTPGSPESILILGSGFAPGAMAQFYDGHTGVGGVPLTYLPAGMLVLNMWTLPMMPAGIYQLQVFEPGLGLSNAVPFTILPNPTILCTPSGGTVFVGSTISCSIDGSGSDAGVQISSVTGLTLDPGYVPNPNATSVANFSVDGTTPLAGATFTWTVQGAPPKYSSVGFNVTTPNASPELGPLSVPTTPVPVGTVSVSAPFTDANINDTHAVTFDWGDGTQTSASVTESAGAGVGAATHYYSAPGVYSVTATVVDQRGAAASSQALIVVYDPSSAVHGSGWFSSPAGGVPALPTASGKAQFGFELKYKKDSTPQGEFEFHFDPAAIELHSTSIDWLISDDTYLYFSGVGNGGDGGVYRFQVWGVPGGKSGGSLSVLIWNAADGIVVYNSQLNEPIQIGGGKITVSD